MQFYHLPNAMFIRSITDQVTVYMKRKCVYQSFAINRQTDCKMSGCFYGLLTIYMLNSSSPLTFITLLLQSVVPPTWKNAINGHSNWNSQTETRQYPEFTDINTPGVTVIQWHTQRTVNSLNDSSVSMRYQRTPLVSFKMC